MENTASPNSEKTQELELEEITEEGKKWKIQLPKDKIKEVIYCSCGSLATYSLIRKDGKVISCCEKCALSDKDTPWLRATKQC